VRKAFAENFTQRRELGGACCVYYRGRKVVDLWGGRALGHSRGRLDYDERVCRHWPVFAHQGKERVTVRQLLAHQAGLHALDAAPGAGGALGFADPAAGVGYAYVTNRMGTRLTGDPRDVALRQALDDALKASVLQEARRIVA
jgi:CubicO group peptidase (beta-lactamase class C family)